jgi:hypothetical protein
MEYDWVTPFDDVRSTERSVRRPNTLGAISLILLVALALFTPLWQQGVHRTLQREYSTLLSTHRTLEEQAQVLRATISAKGMPESLADDAWRNDIDLVPITTQMRHQVVARNP